MDDENKVNSSLPYGFDDEEDEESVSATPAAIKPDMKIVQGIFAIVVEFVAKELRTDENED